MKHFKYQIVVQWDSRDKVYEAYSPTLDMFASRFLPDVMMVARGHSMVSAITNAENKYAELFREARALGILLPPADVGPAEPAGYQAYDEDLGKMVL